MGQNKGKFYQAFFIFMLIVTVMILFIKPPKQFKNRNIDAQTKNIVTILNLKDRIDDYYKNHRQYPKNLDSFKRFYDIDLYEIVEYTPMWDDYALKTKFSVENEKLILTKDKILKEKDEEQNLGGD
ncbi:TPA: hypothetical protein DCW38_01760 [candidate division WOR-3 bacterium]|uniref:Uncharacterized protein n=1 Tax=candidate division WOR-3 bacterium TaxID=2052148 RepID=A0A350H8M6_UNCW3|nr:hypothetical protein [candidate division WOR-3 bacterium]